MPLQQGTSSPVCRPLCIDLGSAVTAMSRRHKIGFGIDKTGRSTGKPISSHKKHFGPPKDEPWYHVLVHNAMHTTYVAERNLEPDTNGDPIRNPMIDELFDGFEAGHYVIRRRAN